jgi:pimeloyl-ACP methyl ester carboxylesterase
MSDRLRIERSTAPVNGAQIAYEVAGSGFPLLLAHAGIADRRMWDEQVQTFAERYQVIRYDMRGYGQTPMVAGPFSHVDDLRELLAFLSIKQAYLLGCSLGGKTCIDLVLAHPELAAALILVGAPPSGWELFSGEPPPQWAEMDAAFEAGDFQRLAELEVQIWVDGPQRTPDQVDSRVRDRVREMNVIALTNEAAGLGSEQPTEPPALGRLAEIGTPTLVIYGDLDVPSIVVAGELLADTIPGAQKVVLTGTAHMPNMEQPAAFNRAVLDFLRGL